MIGEFVMVDANTSPGNNRPGGSGFVESVRGVGAATTATIRYPMELRIENTTIYLSLLLLVWCLVIPLELLKRRGLLL